MGNPMSQASKRTAVIAILLDVAVILGTLLSVVALSLGDLMEIIPLFAPLVASPFFPFFHEIHDLLAVAVVLYATYKYHVRLGVVAILLFLIAHIPYIIAEFTEGAPEILRIFFGVFIALLGIWLINQLQKSQEQTETHSQDARKERRFSQNIIATIPESLLVLDKNLRIKSANRSFYQLFQTNPENTIGRNLPSMLGEEAGTFSAELNRLFGTDDTLENFELHFQSERLGERIFNITARGIIVAEEEEEEEEELVVMQDITVRRRAEEALRQSEAFLAAVFDSITDFITVQDPQYNVIKTNRVVEQTFGKVVGQKCYQVYQGRNDICPDCPTFKVLATGKPAFSAEQIGHGLPFEIWAFPIRDGHGNVIAIVEHGKDITERRRAEDALRKSEENFRRSLEDSPLGIRIVNHVGETVYTNREMLDIYGYTVIGELKATPVKERYTPESYAEHQVRKEKRQRGEYVPSNYEISIVRKNDEIRHLEVFRKEVLWNGQTQFQVLYNDVTERKKLEEELKLRAELLDMANDLIHVTDSDWNMLYVNQASCQSLGYSRDELLGHNLYEFLSPESAKNLPATVHGPPEQGRVVESVHIRKDKTALPVEVHYRIISWGGKKVVLAIVRDITERKRAEEERLKLERKAHNASRLASIGEMAAGIAHEINNPLTPVLGFTEMLMKRELPEGIKSKLKIIYDSTRRTADVTRRLLTFARQSKPMRILCQINEVVESTLQLRAYHLKTNNIKVISELDAELPRTMADASQLQQVLLNLIMNAEYEMTLAHGGGNLLIKTESMSNIIRVSVKDDGPGISKENMDRLFTPFFTTKKVGEGTGLGLSVCHGIVAEHNGRIYAESEVGKGATFIVELPIVKQQKEKEAKPSESDTGEAVEAAKARILVVDDEPTIVQVIKQALTDEGYEVRATGKAKEALRLVEREKFACILLDIKLPDMSGIELYQHLDKTDKSSAQRIIFITGDVVGADTMDFFSGTRACYITKPFGIEQLKKEVKGKLSPEG